MSCDACPFSGTDASEQALNLGCLPEPYEIMQIKREHNINWSCHENEKKLCVGFAQACNEHKINVKDGKLGSYTQWYYTGDATALVDK